MSDLLAFFDEIEHNEDLRHAFFELQDLDDICKLAKSYGYHFSIEELEDYYLQQVAGGGVTGVQKTNYTVSINQNVNGSGNVAVNYGDATAAGGSVDNSGKTKVDPLAFLGALFGSRQ